MATIPASFENGGKVDIFHIFMDVGTHESRMLLISKLRAISPSAEIIAFKDSLEEFEAFEFLRGGFGRCFQSDDIFEGELEGGVPYKYRHIVLATPKE